MTKRELIEALENTDVPGDTEVRCKDDCYFITEVTVEPLDLDYSRGYEFYVPRIYLK